MPIRKIINRFKRIFHIHSVGRSHIDARVIKHKSNKIIQSELHGNVSLGERSVIYHAMISGCVTIGSNTTLWGPDIQVLSIKNPISIGKFCSIARSVTIQEYFHDFNKLASYFIGRNVFGNRIEDEVLLNHFFP